MTATPQLLRAAEPYYRLSGKPCYEPYYHTTRRGWEQAERIDIGKPDPVPVANGDESLAPERLQYEPSVNVRRPQVEKELMAAIKEYGPMTIAQLVQVTGRTETSVRPAIRRCKRIVAVSILSRGKKRWTVYGIVE